MKPCGARSDMPPSNRDAVASRRKSLSSCFRVVWCRSTIIFVGCVADYIVLFLLLVVVCCVWYVVWFWFFTLVG